MAKVLIGLSGGVDSTVAAFLLLSAGHDVTGLTFVTCDAQFGETAAAKDAARQLGIPHVVVDMREEFEKKVIEPFVELYVSGVTPNPCVLCNRTVKFPALTRYADENGFDLIATGHYAEIIKNGETYELHAALDSAKDQTYFLYSLDQKVLSRTLFPLARFTKERVRAVARENGLSVASRPDSQDVCFIPSGDISSLISARCPESLKCGDIVSSNGTPLGKHRGCAFYTVGQRRGLGIPASARLYVKSISPRDNVITLAREDELYSQYVELKDVSFVCGTAPREPFEADVRIRYTKKSAPAVVFPSNGRCLVKFGAKQRAAAPGQAAVFFDGDRLVGGGIIESAR